MKNHEEIHQAFSQVPANRHFGFRLVSQSLEEAVVEMEVKPDLIQETGVVHGGIISTLADTAAVYVFHPYLPDGHSMASIEFKVNFLRAARVDRGELVAHSIVLRRGRKVGVCEVEVTQAKVIIAKGIFTYLFFEKSEKNEDANTNEPDK